VDVLFGLIECSENMPSVLEGHAGNHREPITAECCKRLDVREDTRAARRIESRDGQNNWLPGSFGNGHFDVM